MASLKVVALISGGKDSLFSILHCIANGHEVVALANLHPKASAPEDIDSYMYQTIGHAVIPLYEEALGLPLHRQEIKGGAVNQDRDYGPTIGVNDDEDEAESLIPLLHKVMAAHPEINAVSTGAILSDYQRTRVESVALRLGLTPLSYLWQWPSLPPHSEASLLEDMEAVGQDSRIIKVASGALDDSFLWQNVADRRTRSRLIKAAQRFGALGDGAVLGEGGEYETLAISGPSPIWKKDIIVDEAEREIIQGEAGSSSIQVRVPRLGPKTDLTSSISELRTPTLLGPRFEGLLHELSEASSESSTASERQSKDYSPSDVASLHSANAIFLPDFTGDGIDAAEQMKSLMDRLTRKLAELEHQMTDIVYTTIVMRNMADFPSINAVYGIFFTAPNPPARVTIAAADALPNGSLLSVGVTSIRKLPQERRKGLHVQSRSYWAPANIGPYSQAISAPIDGSSLVYVAGQIPLVPASMEMVSPTAKMASSDFSLQTALSLQHLSRIGDRMEVQQWAGVIAFVVCGPSQDKAEISATVKRAWSSFHRVQSQDQDDDEDEDEDFDVWDVKNRAGYGSFVADSHAERRTADGPGHDGTVPPIHVIRVDALPRGALIEWVGYGMTKGSRNTPVIPHMEHLLCTFHHALL
ncbi:diphthine--ammonia ligase [Acrodontium crateriforme]|uniref:Diphthine--ammonia ligase n=1 Tax=Acrodontium crateriforme TaxID=150365 RepID=A0AAQ3M0W9_9PEZI|nr:diphthine--ammonia ligase [Acrodontium crateriforme]